MLNNSITYRNSGTLRRVELPVSTSIDVTQYTDKWNELSNENFSVIVTGTSHAAISNEGYIYSGGPYANVGSPTINYNNSIGQLTINMPATGSTSVQIGDSLGPVTLTTYAYINLKAVYMYVVE